MSTLVCSPPTPPLRRPRLRFPSPPAYHGASASSEPAARAFADAWRAGGVWGRGLRKPRRARGQTGASQVTGPSSSSVPRSSTPPREAPPRPMPVTPPAAFRVGDPLGFPGKYSFRGCIPTAHVFACLRINRPVAGTAARLTTDLPGSALVGRDSHPLGNSSGFHGITASFPPSGPA
jgi:hypothetical protein